MISADTFCCTVQVTSHLKDVKHFSSQCVSWHSQKEASKHGRKQRTRQSRQSDRFQRQAGLHGAVRGCPGAACSSGNGIGINRQQTNCSDCSGLWTQSHFFSLKLTCNGFIGVDDIHNFIYWPTWWTEPNCLVCKFKGKSHTQCTCVAQPMADQLDLLKQHLGYRGWEVDEGKGTWSPDCNTCFWS